MALADLTDQLMRDAHAESDAIEREAHERADLIRQETARMVEERQRQLLAAATRTQERERKRLEAEQAIIERQGILRKKREELDRTFDEALARSRTLPANRRNAILTTLLARTRRELGAPFTLRAAKRDAATLRKAARVTGTIDAAGGFVASSIDGTAHMDCTFDRIIADIKARDAPRIARILFGETAMKARKPARRKATRTRATARRKRR